MGDITLFPHVNTTYTIFSIKVLYIISPHCLNGTLPCVDFMDVTMGARLLGIVIVHNYVQRKIMMIQYLNTPITASSNLHNTKVTQY